MAHLPIQYDQLSSQTYEHISKYECALVEKNSAVVNCPFLVNITLKLFYRLNDKLTKKLQNAYKVRRKINKFFFRQI